MKRIYFSIFIGIISLSQSMGQNIQYEVELTPVTIPELGGIQSYAVATYKGEWLLIGGRLDGLHRRQPFASFDTDGHNQNIIVVNPESKKVWTKSIAMLPVALKEQLASTNMQFYQNQNHLILTGGYGYSPTVGDHVTYPYLTVVDIPNVIQNVKSGTIESKDFNQIENEIFQVTGGRLAMIDEVFFLVGGHKFMGRYNPIGPDHGPGFEQEYTHEVRKFTLDIGEEINITSHTNIHDEMHLRRRDYNLVPSIINDEYGLTAYSGVFQNGTDLPWLYPVQFAKDSYTPIESFSQYFNHYHCATLPIYNETEEEMHTLIFGGIAQFYMDQGVLVQDNDVPFVNTIADVSLAKGRDFKESILNESMPGYFGAGSEFIFSSEVNFYESGILSGDILKNEYVDIGYIFGGIRSSLPNIFWINTGTESEASSTIFRVSIRKKMINSSKQLEVKEDKVLFYPNPAQSFVKMSIELEKSEEVKVEIYDLNGSKIHSQIIPKTKVKEGHNLIMLENVNIGYGAFLYKVAFGNKTITRKVIWAE